ncbi:zinc finger MYM-type protein 1-like [Prunus avium]|uniref:Zinc finger MYM-type protein 1-like n=1 Tax=Prunus avium TaxID=42229 RepID=A0A6P5RJS3_PRUAV|nr:zinc finger MYM-type protein 1-like [Prunus avium]
MEKYFKRKAADQLSPPLRTDALNHGTAKRQCEEINLADLPSDPGLRTRILDYNPTVQDQVRRAYLQRGPCQPKKHNFPQTNFSNTIRRFNPAWFDEYASWLEYSIEKDAAYCLYCYLFKPNNGEQAGGDSFVKNWKKKEKLKIHVGGTNSAHNHARRMCEALLNQRQHVETFFFKQSHQDRSDYRIQLNASIDCIRYLLRQGMAFRGHDESDDSNNKGNFLELLHWYSNRNEEVKKVVLKNAPANLKLTSPDIQKDIVNAAAIETLNKIIGDVGNSLFSILIDESCDISGKEQMAIVLRYVCKGHVIERFVGVEHVNDTTALSLKKAIDNFFSRNKLSISRLRGQGYDGASNMRGEFNGLKTHILKENESAYYVHCFAHQLQLVLVSVPRSSVRL